MKNKPINNSIIKTLIALILFTSNISHAKKPDDDIAPSYEGNFALPFSQQLSPLVSFGQNIISKNQTIVSLGAGNFLGNRTSYTYLNPNIIYGITDFFSVFLEVPVAVENQSGSDHSRGLQDIPLQFEYAFWYRDTKSTTNMATLVANVTFPTGSYKTEPSLGLGSPSFFLGATYSFTNVNWYFFLAPGFEWTTNWTGHTPNGDQFLYEMGFGGYITSSRKAILSWLLEFDGGYTWGTRNRSKNAPTSGGNVIYITPSITYARETIMLQFGPGFPIVQSYTQPQPTQYISFNFNFSYTFG